MSSEDLTLASFLGKIECWNAGDIIQFADREATSAERRYHRVKRRSMRSAAAYLSYAENLKHLVRFLRHGVTSSRLNATERTAIRQLTSRIEKRSAGPRLSAPQPTPGSGQGCSFS
jgi:hypothetical protein